jgi:hypothetical protein
MSYLISTNRRPDFWEDFMSLIYAAGAFAIIVAVWKALLLYHVYAVNAGLLIAYAFIKVVVFDWVAGKDWFVDLNFYRWQAAPIAAAGMTIGWTAHSGDIAVEENAILLAASAIFALFSIATFSESLYPHLPKAHPDWKPDDNKKRRCLLLRLLFVQLGLAGVIGSLASWASAASRLP